MVCSVGRVDRNLIDFYGVRIMTGLSQYTFVQASNLSRDEQVQVQQYNPSAVELDASRDILSSAADVSGLAITNEDVEMGAKILGVLPSERVPSVPGDEGPHPQWLQTEISLLRGISAQEQMQGILRQIPVENSDIASTSKADGLVTESIASSDAPYEMARIEKPDNLDDPAVLKEYRTALVDRHLREALGLNANGTYSNGKMHNAYEMLPGIIERDMIAGAEDVATILENANAKLEPAEQITYQQRNKYMKGVTEGQRQALLESIVESGIELNERTRSEQWALQMGNPDQLAYDATLHERWRQERIRSDD